MSRSLLALVTALVGVGLILNFYTPPDNCGLAQWYIHYVGDSFVNDCVSKTDDSFETCQSYGLAIQKLQHDQFKDACIGRGRR